MTLDGTEGGVITLEAASALTAEHRRKNSGGTVAHYFGKNNVHNLLNQQGCMGMRAYYGLDTSGARQLVLVGVDASGNDMLGMIVDLSYPCPDKYCSSTNALNS